MGDRKVTWLIEPHEDMPAAPLLLELRPDAVRLSPQKPGFEAWPEVQGPAVAYGSMRTLTRMQRHPTLFRAVFDDYPLLRFSSYSRAIYDLLGRSPVIVPLEALPHVPLEAWFGPQVFVRPDSNFKLVVSEVLSAEQLRALPQRYAAHRDELVVLCSPVELGQEYRVFCRDGKAVTSSSYPDAPYRSTPREAVEFAEQAASRLLSLGLRCVTVDVALGKDRQRVVEVGGWNSWGLYGCDPKAFIAAMEAEALQRFEDSL